MSTRIKDSQPVTDTYGDQYSLAFHDALDTITAEQPNGAADPTIQELQDPRFQLARQGVDIPSDRYRCGPTWPASVDSQRRITPLG
jgi:hypothetical protein